MNSFVANAHLHDPSVDIAKVKLVELRLPVVPYILKIPRWEVEFALLSYSSFQSQATLRVKKKVYSGLGGRQSSPPLAESYAKIQGSRFCSSQLSTKSMIN